MNSTMLPQRDSRGNYGGLAGGGLSQFFSGLFGNSDEPFKDAAKELEKYLSQAKEYQNPFYNAGVGGIGKYQDWLKSQENPSEFINNLMGKYQESPWARYQQNQNNRAATNFGSENGLIGSTPLLLQQQQNAQNLSSQDMQGWLQNVLGINNNVGQGYGNLINTGANSANALTNLLSNYGENFAGLKYGQTTGKNQDRNDIFGGLMSILGI
jgi:hypothetical protein